MPRRDACCTGGAARWRGISSGKARARLTLCGSPTAARDVNGLPASRTGVERLNAERCIRRCTRRDARSCGVGGLLRDDVGHGNPRSGTPGLGWRRKGKKEGKEKGL